jgi:hypothetical protein
MGEEWSRYTFIIFQKEKEDGGEVFCFKLPYTSLPTYIMSN